MALQQHHLLSDVTVRGFVAGATNILFRQQKHLSDAIVEVGLRTSACSWHSSSLLSFLSKQNLGIVITLVAVIIASFARHPKHLRYTNNLIFITTGEIGVVSVHITPAEAEEQRGQTAAKWTSQDSYPGGLFLLQSHNQNVFIV